MHRYEDCGCEQGYHEQYPDPADIVTFEVGDRAIDFSLESTQDRAVSLSDYKGKWVIMFFFPLCFTDVCASEVTAFNRRLREFEDLGAAIIGINTDSVYTQKAWLESIGLVNYPLLSDYDKEVSGVYGILNDGLGAANRALFIIDGQGIIRYKVVHEPSVGRSVDETLRVLSALVNGGSCPVDWKPGDPVL